MNNNISYKCYAGLEIKAHGDSSAAAGVLVNNHMSIKIVVHLILDTLVTIEQQVMTNH